MAGRRPTGKRSNPEATRFFFAWRKHPWNYANLQRDSFLRFALSAKAPRPARICPYLQIVGKYYRLFGGAEWIRTLVPQVDRIAALVHGRVTRKYLLGLLAELEPCLVRMEACGSAHPWGREIVKLGHTVKLMRSTMVVAVGNDANSRADGNSRRGWG